MLRFTFYPAPSTAWRACAALVVLPVVAAADPAAAPASAAGAEAAHRASTTLEAYHEEGSELNKERMKAALAELDAEIEQLQRRAEAAPDSLQRRTAERRVKALETRRDALRREFHATRFDELKADVRREWNEFKGWVRSKTDEETTPTNPSPQDQALARVDAELDRLAERAEKLDATDQKRVEARLHALRERRTALQRDFNRERYRALIEEIQSEIQKPRAAAE